MPMFWNDKEQRVEEIVETAPVDLDQLDQEIEVLTATLDETRKKRETAQKMVEEHAAPAAAPEQPQPASQPIPQPPAAPQPEQVPNVQGY